MIRNITQSDATRGTHRTHGRPLYGIYFGTGGASIGDGELVQIEQSRGMVRLYAMQDSGMRGERIESFGAATRFWLAAIPMPALGDELIYVAEGDGQHYRVRVTSVPTVRDGAPVEVALISDGSRVWVNPYRLHHDIDTLHAEALAENADRIRASEQRQLIGRIASRVASAHRVERDDRPGVLGRVVAVVGDDIADVDTMLVAWGKDADLTSQYALPVAVREPADRLNVAIMYPNTIDLAHAEALDEDMQRSARPVLLTLAVDTWSEPTTEWKPGWGRKVSTATPPQQLADQVAESLDRPGTHRVLVWRTGESAPAGERVVTVKRPEPEQRRYRVRIEAWNEALLTFDQVHAEWVEWAGTARELADQVAQNQNHTDAPSWRVTVLTPDTDDELARVTHFDSVPGADGPVRVGDLVVYLDDVHPVTGVRWILSDDDDDPGAPIVEIELRNGSRAELRAGSTRNARPALDELHEQAAAEDARRSARESRHRAAVDELDAYVPMFMATSSGRLTRYGRADEVERTLRMVIDRYTLAVVRMERACRSLNIPAGEVGKYARALVDQEQELDRAIEAALRSGRQA
jgi:hypothetical protein